MAGDTAGGHVRVKARRWGALLQAQGALGSPSREGLGQGFLEASGEPAHPGPWTSRLQNVKEHVSAVCGAPGSSRVPSSAHTTVRGQSPSSGNS